MIFAGIFLLVYIPLNVVWIPLLVMITHIVIELIRDHKENKEIEKMSEELGK
jgi:hypothetical protein